MTEVGKPTLKTLIDPDLYAADTQINPADINDGMIQQASLFAHYSTLYARAQAQYDRFRQLQEIIDAKLDRSIREEMQSAGEKITEKAIEQRIALSASHINAVRNVNFCREQVELSKCALEALKQKRDMLVQLGVQAREEMKGELYIKSAEAREEARRAQRQKLLERTTAAAVETPAEAA